MANPIVPQGTLNRLRASITFPGFTSLNISMSFLGKEAISMSFDGVATTSIETMTGIVQSPEPYQKVSFRAHLIKSQALANAFKQQFESSTLIGDCTIRPDAINLDPYQLSNVALSNVDPLKFDGTDAGWVLMGTGIYYINSSLWNF